jgi:hypothetical protein
MRGQTYCDGEWWNMLAATADGGDTWELRTYPAVPGVLRFISPADDGKADMDTAGIAVLTLPFRQENRRWTGECVELGTATYGRTLNQTHDELVELVGLHLDALEATGERERFLRIHNLA